MYSELVHYKIKGLWSIVKYLKQTQKIVFKNSFEKWTSRIFNYTPTQMRSKKKFIEYLHSKDEQLIYSKNSLDETAVTLACENADLTTVKLLEELGSDINQTDKYGRNGMMIAAAKGKNDIIKFLHSKNDQFIHAKDYGGDTGCYR